MSRLIHSLILCALVGLAAWLVWHRTHRQDMVIPKEDGVTVVRPRAPILPSPDDVAFADTTGRVRRINVEDRGRVDATITVDVPADTDHGNADPVQLLVRIRPARGLIPEIRGRMQELSIRAISGGNLVTVTHQPRPFLDVELRPYLGAMLSSGIGPVAGVSLVRIGPIHLSAGIGTAGDERMQVAAFGLASTTLWGPVSLTAGIRIHSTTSPTVGIVIPF